MTIGYRKGFCCIHPTIPVCAEDPLFCRSCYENQRPSPKVETQTETSEPAEKKKRGRKADPQKVAERLAKEEARAARKAAKEESKRAFAAAMTGGQTKIVPVLVVIRGASEEEVRQKESMLTRSFWRKGRIDYLPRVERNPHDANRAKFPDIVIGDLVKDLDPEPWALWTALDPDYVGKSDYPEFYGIDENGLQIYFADIPDERNPSRWKEVEGIHGAEVIDLRNYPKVLEIVKDAIPEILAEMRGWTNAFRMSVAGRNQVAIYKTLPDGSELFYALKEQHNSDNVTRPDPAIHVRTIHHEHADRSANPSRLTRFVEIKGD